MDIVMISVLKAGSKTVGFRLLDLDYGQVLDVNYNAVKEQMINGIIIENLKIENNKIIGSNGSIERYPLIDYNTKLLVGKSPLIILMELANNAYRVCDSTGNIFDITLDSLINYYYIDGIANGKVINTENTKYISPIKGEYRKDKLLQAKKYGEKLKVKMDVLGAEYKLDERYYARLLQGSKAESIVLGKGVLGIQPYGFKDALCLKEIILPATLEFIGEGAFLNTRIEEIVIPEGIAEIPPRCFALCKELKQVSLPNSLKTIRQNAFYNCNKLKVIHTGPSKLTIAFGAIPRGTKRIIRKSDVASE